MFTIKCLLIIEFVNNKHTCFVETMEKIKKMWKPKQKPNLELPTLKCYNFIFLMIIFLVTNVIHI